MGEPGMRMLIQPGSPRMLGLGWGAGQSCRGSRWGLRAWVEGSLSRGEPETSRAGS